MKKVCKHCEGAGSVRGPVHAIVCQICDGEDVVSLIPSVLSLLDIPKPTPR